jgi:hypothetical protein
VIETEIKEVRVQLRVETTENRDLAAPLETTNRLETKKLRLQADLLFRRLKKRWNLEGRVPRDGTIKNASGNGLENE